jgi:CubicO group peptidase (beta-lactamase class C family)
MLGEWPGEALAEGSVKLPRARPGSLGIDPAGILAFVEGVDQKVGGLHSFMLLRHGKVAAEGWWEPYAPKLPHMLYSLSKSFTSTAVGLAVEEKLLTVDDPVTSFFPEQLPKRIEPNLRAMKVRHLLSMSTGHDKDATGPTRQAPDGDWVRAFLALPVEHAPGSKFVYNSAATYMCSAIVQKLTGKTLLEYLTPRLFEPLGIEGPTWESCPRGINTGGWGLSIRTEDIARFGQLYLQRGKWGKRQLVPAAWIGEATRKQISNGDNPNSDWAQGYGYQFWRCRHGAFRGDGAFGQYCVVMPEQDAVLAITSGVRDMQAVLNLVWEHLLPAMRGGSNGSTDSAALKEKLGKLTVPPPEGKADAATARMVSGRTYRFETNDERIETATPVFHKKGAAVVLRRDGKQQRLNIGSDEWVSGKAPLGDRAAAPIAARGAWESADTYTAKVCYVDTPYVQTQTWKFEGDRVTVTRKMNVGFGGATDSPKLVGRSMT